MWISNFGWNGQAILMYEANLNVAVAYVCNHGYHNQTHFYQYFFRTEHFSAVKLAKSRPIQLWEKYELSFDMKISKSFKNLKRYLR